MGEIPTHFIFMESIIDKLKKIKELVDRGYRGEQQAVKEMKKLIIFILVFIAIYLIGNGTENWHFILSVFSMVIVGFILKIFKFKKSWKQ